MIRPLLILLVIVLPALLPAQANYIFHHLTPKDGLASQYVETIFQDSKGFYWIGTTSGLQKFDGHTFSRPIKEGKDLLTSARVTETRDGTIWVSNGTALYRYNRTSERFNAVVPDGEKPRMNLHVIEDSAGNIWLLNDRFLYKYDNIKKKPVTWITFPAGNAALTPGAIAYNKSGTIVWLQTGLTLYTISPIKKQIAKTERLPGQVAQIWANGNDLWISYWTQDLCRYNTITAERKWFRLPVGTATGSKMKLAVANCFARDRSGKLWIGAIDGGLWYYNGETETFQQLKPDNYKPEAFHFNDMVYVITVDNAGNCWVGSDRGINIFNPSYQPFNSILNTDFSPGNSISAISQKPFETSTGDILLTTYNSGWCHFDNQFQLKRKLNGIIHGSPGIAGEITNATCFAEDKRSRIWVGHTNGLVGIYEPLAGKILYTTIPEFNKAKVCNIQCDTAGNMWFALRGSTNSLAMWNAKTGRYKMYNDSLLMNRYQGESSIVVTGRGEIWVETSGNGLYRFDPVNEKISEIYRDEQPPHHIPNQLHDITELNDSSLGIMSFHKGFFLFNTHTKTTATLNTDDKLPSNISRALARDRHNNFWLASLGDLVRLNPLTKKVVSFDEEDGVLDKSFTYGFSKLRDGRLIIANSNGMLYFNPDSVKIQSRPADVQLSGLRIMNQSVLVDSILNTVDHTLYLTHDQNFLTIDYVSISYINRKTTQYYYKLSGLEKNWVNAGTQRTATYTNLSPGKYLFLVRCENRDGIGSKHTTYMTIIISPPWWRSWWSYLLYGLLFSSIAYYIYTSRIKTLQKKQKAEIEAIVATQEGERKRISRDLHDDVGTKLSALKLFLSSLHDKAAKTNNEEIMSLANSSKQFITEAMQDVRQLLLNLSPTVLEEFGYTTAVEGLVNKINETHAINFKLVVFGMSQRLRKEYELVLYRLTQELINNVLKHAEAKNVSLQIGQRDAKIILMMEDDGKGFDINAHKEGYGLQNLYARTKLMQGTINIESKPGKGTSVLIEMPYN